MMKAIEVRTWICTECKYKTHWTYNQLANEGSPICPNCDDVMELIDE